MVTINQTTKRFLKAPKTFLVGLKKFGCSISRSKVGDQIFLITQCKDKKIGQPRNFNHQKKWLASKCVHPIGCIRRNRHNFGASHHFDNCDFMAKFLQLGKTLRSYWLNIYLSIELLYLQVVKPLSSFFNVNLYYFAKLLFCHG